MLDYCSSVYVNNDKKIELKFEVILKKEIMKTKSLITSCHLFALQYKIKSICFLTMDNTVTSFGKII